MKTQTEQKTDRMSSIKQLFKWGEASFDTAMRMLDALCVPEREAEQFLKGA